MSTLSEHQLKKMNRIITIISIALPLAVVILFGVKLKVNLSFDPHLLPMINAVLNSISALTLIGALIAVKQKNIRMHSRLIYLAMAISLLFLLLYVFYHIITDSTKYNGSMGYLYYPLLISHIILAAVQAPMVLFAFLYGFSGQIDKHKRLVKISYPVWLYVSISGVICYLMISPYYQ
jgi:putative membrane protein